MRAGRMRHRVVVQQRSASQTSTGEPANTWSTFATRWASMDAVSGREFFASQQRNAAVATTFRMRALTGLVPRMRLLVGGTRIFDVIAVMLQGHGDKAENVVMAEEQVEET